MLLGEMAKRVMGTRTFEETIQTILDDVIAFHGAQYGFVQLPVGDDLVIAAQRGFGPQFLRMIRHLKKDNGFSCGRAQRDGQSIVVADRCRERPRLCVVPQRCERSRFLLCPEYAVRHRRRKIDWNCNCAF